MSEAKFTKGEWVVHIIPVYLNHGYASVECGDVRIHGKHMYNPTEIEATANAYLIAAAPEMYEMLEALLNDEDVRIPSWKALSVSMLLAKSRGEK